MDKYDQEIYREEILEHYRHPQNFGAIIKPTHVGSSENPLCGDSITLELSIKNKKVSDVRFRGAGCGLSTASASLFTEWIKGKPEKTLKNVSDDVLFQLIKAPITPMRRGCVLLPLSALRKAINV